MVDVGILDDMTADAACAIERIFFASAARTVFADESERLAFRERWLGRYLAHDRQHVFVARDGGGSVIGYLAGCLDDPARAGRFDDIAYYRDFAGLTVRFPAHLHINLDEAWRGRGVGGQLIEAFAHHAGRHGKPGIHIVTGATARNVGFYRRCAFEPLREAQWNGASVLMMGREIAGASAGG
jgi:GNAT superfamily N-acetyltransferase